MKLAGRRDNPDDCKIGDKLPAAVCKLIIIPPGVRLINLTDVWVAARVINFAHKLFTLSKLHLQPCCHFLLDFTLDKTCERRDLVAKNIPALACFGKQVLITAAHNQDGFTLPHVAVDQTA